MKEDLSFILGWVTIFLLCAWGVGYAGYYLRAHLRRGVAVDQTLSEIDRRDAPAMYRMQILGYILLIFASAVIGIGAVTVVVLRFTAD